MYTINFSIKKSVYISKKIFSLTQFHIAGRNFSYFCVNFSYVCYKCFQQTPLNASSDVVLVEFECAVRNIINAA
jgi:hypothetical protein